MAALQLRGDSYRLIFQYLGQQQSCTLGDISPTKAQQCKTRCEQLLMRQAKASRSPAWRRHSGYNGRQCFPKQLFAANDIWISYALSAAMKKND